MSVCYHIGVYNILVYDNMWIWLTKMLFGWFCLDYLASDGWNEITLSQLQWCGHYTEPSWGLQTACAVTNYPSYLWQENWLEISQTVCQCMQTSNTFWWWVKWFSIWPLKEKQNCLIRNINCFNNALLQQLQFLFYIYNTTKFNIYMYIYIYIKRQHHYLIIWIPRCNMLYKDTTLQN